MFETVDDAVAHYQEIIKLRKEGLTCAAIGAQLGCKGDKIGNTIASMKAQGIPVPKGQGQIRSEALQRLAEMVE